MSVLRAVWQVAAPATVFQLLVFANNFVDYQWVAALGKEAAAGQTAGWTLLWMLLSIGQIFSIGTTAVVARRVGERREDAASHAAGQGLRGALTVSVVIGVAGWFAVPHFVAGNHSSPLAAKHTLDYLRVACVGAPLLFAFYALEGAFKGRGDMQRPLRAVAIALGLNMLLDPLLIHVAGLEVLGAALATVLAFGFTAALLARAALHRGWLRLRGGIDLALVGRIVRIGTPVSVHGIVFSAVYIFIVREVNRAGGDAAGAALGLGLRLEGFAYLTGVGCAAAASALVGQSLGAGDVRRAHDSAWVAVRLAVYLSGVWGLFFLVMPRPLAELLSPGPATTGYALDYFAIVAPSLVFTAVELVLEGAFSGAGDTVPPMLLSIPLTLVRIPLAILLARGLGWGAAGVFWSLTWSSVARGLAVAFWFARGRWIHGKA